MTLLVIDIAVPVGSRDLWRTMADHWPLYLAYFVSFSTIGAIWLAHSDITVHLKQADAPLIRLNLNLLLVVSFLPFPTRLLSVYIGPNRQEEVAATIFGVNLLLASTLVSVLWRYSMRQGLAGPTQATKRSRC
jgi:uncharacterized membrane protein